MSSLCLKLQLTGVRFAVDFKLGIPGIVVGIYKALFEIKSLTALIVVNPCRPKLEEQINIILKGAKTAPCCAETCPQPFV